MTTTPPTPPNPAPNQSRLELIASYLDGSLDHSQADAFEKSLAQDPSLQAEVQFQRRLDASLGRIFDFEPAAAAAAAPAEAPASIPMPAPRAAPSRWRLGALISVAAALLLALGLTLYFLNPPDPHLIGPDKVYAKLQAINFAPQWKCKNNQEFIETVQKHLGESLLVPDDAAAGLQVVGWAYSSSYDKYAISPNTLILITKKNDDNILLLIDRASADRKLSVPKASGLHLFRDTVGGLVLYEVTPRSEPVVIPIAKQNESACPAKGKP